MKNIVVSQRRIFIAKAMWRISAPTVIGEIEEVVKEILNGGEFKNGVEFIKELEGTKFVRVSKKDLQRLLDNTPEQVDLFKQLSKVY